MSEEIIKFEEAIDRSMEDALKAGLTPKQVYEVGFGKLVNRSLQKGVKPQDIAFECLTCQQQLAGMAIAKSRQNQTVIEAINGAPDPRRGGSPFVR